MAQSIDQRRFTRISITNHGDCQNILSLALVSAVGHRSAEGDRPASAAAAEHRTGVNKAGESVSSGIRLGRGSRCHRPGGLGLTQTDQAAEAILHCASSTGVCFRERHVGKMSRIRKGPVSDLQAADFFHIADLGTGTVIIAD